MKKKLLFLWIFPAVFIAGVMVQSVCATSYTIRDGGRTYHYTGFASDAATVLEKAGVQLDDRDQFTLAERTITVRRAPVVELSWHGQLLSVPAQEETVENLLNRLGLQREEGDELNVPAQTLVYHGMQLRVDRVLRREECYTRCLPHETREVCSPQLPSGSRQVLTQGRDGTLKCRAWVTYVNGVETQREILEESLVTSPITEIVAMGIGSARAKAAPQVVVTEDELLLPTGERLHYKKKDYVRATAYTHTDAGCTSTTATNTRVHRGTVAVDPRYIPYGTRMFIMASDGSYIYGLAEAEDCGGDIKGDRMDLYLPSYEECIAFGRRTCTVYFLE